MEWWNEPGLRGCGAFKRAAGVKLAGGCVHSSDKVILMWQLRLRIGPAEPRALGVNRLRVEAVWATASLIMRRSVLIAAYSFLWVLRSSALAMADLRVLATKRAPLRGTTARTAWAWSAGNP